MSTHIESFEYTARLPGLPVAGLSRAYGRAALRAQSEIAALTGLRGLAAIWVMTTHFYAALELPTNFITGHGFYGMFIFFVLSGFILGHVHDRDFSQLLRISTAFRFLGLRLAKIYPLHLLITIVWALVLVPWHIWPTVARDNGMAFGLNVLLMHAWGFVPEYTWNLPSWSISIEWLCYLVFPLLPFFLSHRSLIVLLGLAIGLHITICTEAPVVVLGWLSGIGPGIALSGAKQALHYFEMFLLGYFVFLIGTRLPVGLFGSLIWDIIAASVLLGVYAGSWLTEDLSSWIPLASAVLILCLAQQGPVFERILGNAVTRYLGEISYCIYMCHIMAYAVLVWAWYDYIGGKAPIWAAFFTALIVSAAAYHFLERPMRLALRRWIAPGRSRSHGLCSTRCVKAPAFSN
jgi:peptidoglycan/LPS O-acetylase OafA/YrhL